MAIAIAPFAKWAWHVCHWWLLLQSSSSQNIDNHWTIIITMVRPVATPFHCSALTASAVLQSTLKDSIVNPTTISDPIELFGSHYNANGGNVISMTPPAPINNDNLTWKNYLKREMPPSLLANLSLWPHCSPWGSVVPHGQHTHHLAVRSSLLP